MDHQAHGLDLTHAIFNTPRKPEFAFTPAAMEDQYKGKESVLYPKGMDTLQLTKFEQEKGYWNPILVNHAGFFTDIPGLENLAEGHSGKVLGSVSLVRQGRYFYWGYTIDPERMTKPSRDTFVNVLHYMHSKRHSLTVEFVCKPRMILWTLMDLNRRKPSYKRGLEEHLPGQLVPEWRKTYTDRSLLGCQAWLDKYLAYVFSGKSPKHTGEFYKTRYKSIYEVDSDAMELGTPNALRKSLEQWMQLSVGKDEKLAELANRCLSRYVHPSIAPKSESWNNWYGRFKDRIVFIESTGFWWQEDPRILELEHATVQEASAGKRQQANKK